MNRTISWILLACLTLVAASCRKGENDPFLSLRTRKARITGKWNLTAMETTSFYTGAGTTIAGSASYDGTTETSVNAITSPSGVTSTNTQLKEFTLELDIRKDGTYAETRITHYGSWTETVVTEGAWNFLAKSRKNGLRNKEAVMFTPVSISYDGSEPTIFTSLSGTAYVISELRNSTMTWTTESRSVFPEGSQETRTRRTFTQR